MKKPYRSNGSLPLQFAAAYRRVVRRTFNVRFGSKADICSAKRHVRFTPKADMCGALAHVRFVPIADMTNA
jgi:hypothetical protein